MNVLTVSDLNDEHAPLLRTGADDVEEFLLATFADIELYAAVSSASSAASSDPISDDDVDRDASTLPHNGSSGTLFVTTSRVVWIGAAVGPRVGYAWEMASVTLHAISRDPAAFPTPCVYCQMSSQDVSEVHFVPADDHTLQEVFRALCKSAEMNPDEDEDNEDDGWICDEEEVADGARAAQLAAHFDSMLQVSPELEHCGTELGQFDDAIEESLL